MKAISIRQPWANMIFHSQKTVEARNLVTGYRGDLFIHAGAIRDKADFLKLGLDTNSIPTYQQQCLIGIVKLVDIKPFTEELWEKLREIHQIPGKWLEFKYKYAWFFENPYEIEPISYKGIPSLFTIDSQTLKQLKPRQEDRL